MKVILNEKNNDNVFEAFAKILGATAEGRYFYIPKNKGGGYITGVNKDEDLRILIRNFYLNEETLLERTNIDDNKNHVIFSFNNVFEPIEEFKNIPKQKPSVFIFSQKVSSIIKFPANTSFRSINIGTSQNYLKQLLGKVNHPIIERILQNDEHFAFEIDVTHAIIKVANEFISEKTNAVLEELFFKTKANEMLYFLFDSLLKRKVEQVGRIHIDDIKALYKIKMQLEVHLDIPPNIAQLAKDAKMSEPKLRKLFKQTFGKNVFDYYQSLRMQEAARLLKEEHLSVSEVGYQLGYSNLSHFGRVFEEYIGIKPKKYSSTKIREEK